MTEKKGEHPFGDTGQLLLAGLFLLIWASDTFVLRWSTFLATYVPQFIRMGLLALALVIVAILVSQSHHVVTGEQRPNYVVDTGPFRYVRHPLYLAALLTYLGIAISSFSLISFLLLIPIFIFYDYIAGYEEKLLDLRFGEAYRLYEQRTGKWWPRARFGSNQTTGRAKRRDRHSG